MAGAVPGIHRGSSGNVCSLISSLILLSALSHCLLANQPELTPEQLGVLSMIHCGNPSEAAWGPNKMGQPSWISLGDKE